MRGTVMLAVPRTKLFEAAARNCFHPGFEENFCHLYLSEIFFSQWLK
jgi:hypothetical protein